MLTILVGGENPFRGGTKIGPVYLLLCTVIHSVNLVPLRQKGGIEYGLAYYLQKFGGDFTRMLEVIFAL